jgi:hypothetical protein
LQRIGQAEDIASAILLLACEQARFITGAYLPVSVGIQMLETLIASAASLARVSWEFATPHLIEFRLQLFLESGFQSGDRSFK